ncbi:MAG TPA: hypothetical protein VGR10_00785 [Thermoleophilaceae bacterium]|nr:hypothetical protein [Thermoleophilaceae bacterium]
MLDWIPDLVTASALSYLVILGFVWLDAWFPVVPGETLGGGNSQARAPA